MQTVIRLALTLLGQLPLPVLHGMAAVLGEVLWRVPNRFRQLSEYQIRLCFPQRDVAWQRRVARRSLIESLKAVFEAPAIWFGPTWRLRRWIGDAEAARAFAAAGSAGKGTIWLTPHQGAWELAGLFCAQFGPITTLYKPQKGAFDAVIQQGRSRLATAKLVPTEARGVKAVLGALQRGECVGILPDHDPPEGSGRWAPFFGVPAHTMDLVPKLAARSGAAVWFIVAERLSWGRGFRFHFVPAPAGIADAASGVAALNRGVENCVDLLPQQYWWSYRRFRRQPPDAPDPYAGMR